MKASKFSDAQKAFILKQGEEGTPVAEICRKAGFAIRTCFAGHTDRSDQARHALRPKPDHPIGAGHLPGSLARVQQSAAI